MASTIGDPGATRAVGSRRIPAGDARTAIVRMTISAPVADVWNAVTSEEHVARWYSPVAGDFRLGGTVSVGAFATCEILACDPPRSFRATWVHPGRPVDEIELRLTAEGAGTTHLEFAHAMVPKLVEWEGQMLDPLPDVGANWEFSLSYLPPYLGGAWPEGRAVDWFQMTPEVEVEMARRNDAWMKMVMSPAGSE
jgi:uncharacterized protein YndB with AHSA1/START domain